MEREIQLAEAAGIDADDTGEHAEEVVIDFDFLNSVKQKLVSTCPKSSLSFTICRVPAHIRDSDPAAYSPRIISIGPFHRQSTNLQAMEEHKWRYLREVLCRSMPLDLEKLLNEMKAIEAQARDCYSEKIRIGSNEFVEMMVLDGCFILQFIHDFLYFNFDEINDPIYRNESMSDTIFHDMLLLENQLPFFVLERLWELIGESRRTLWEAASFFFLRAFPDERGPMCPEEPDIKIHHLLHAVHLSLRRAREPESCGRLVRTVKTLVPCAMELEKVGFKFRRKHAKSFFDVTFNKGLMKMPYLFINDYTNAFFRNFIVFEQCFPEWGNHFTSYCFLIDALVNAPGDVAILTQSNIIEHGLGSDEDVVLLFNKLCKDVSWSDQSSYLANMFEKINKHAQKRRPIWQAKLVFSGIAAIIILNILALVQTFFAVFAYFRPPKP